ncbi:MAG: hypothetical protein KBF12_02915 [Sebaldella sp.]|nr:hypothetical protein [Sebaldella sp.]
MYKKTDFKVGQKLYTTKQERHHLKPKLIEKEILSIGIKYLMLTNQTKVLISDLSFLDYNINNRFYTEKQKCLDIIELYTLRPKVLEKLSWSKINNLSIDKIRKIKEILESEEE